MYYSFESQKSKMSWQDGVSFGTVRIHSLPFPASKGCPHSLAYSSHHSTSASIVTYAPLTLTQLLTESVSTHNIKKKKNSSFHHFLVLKATHSLFKNCT